MRDEAYEEEDDRKRAPRRFTRVFHKLDSVGWTGDRRKHVFVVDVDGGEPTQLTSGDFEHGSPAWSPDGKQIVFDGLRDERWDTELINRLYVVDADGRRAEGADRRRRLVREPVVLARRRAHRVPHDRPRTARTRTTRSSA